MALQFIRGGSGSGKSWYGYHEIISRAIRHPEREFLILVPEQFTMQTQKELVSLHPDGGIFNIDVLSFQRLAYRIFEETGGSPYPLLEETGKSLVVQRVVQERSGELGLLAGTLKASGAVSQMKSLISELKQYQIAPEALGVWRERAEGKRLLTAKLADVEVVYRAFDEYLRERYVTAEDVLEVLAARLSESKRIRRCEVLVDGFTGFTPVQIGVLGELFRWCPKVMVTVIMDGREQPYGRIAPHELFAMSRRLIRQLTEKARETGCELLPEHVVKRSGNGRFRPGSGLDHLEQNLFRYGKREYKGEDPGIHICVMEHPRQELERIAGRIRRLVREKGYRYKDFAVLTGDLSVYGTYAKEIFRNADIPCFVDEKHSVLMNPFVEFLRSAVDMAAGGFSYESVFRYLRCGLSGLSREETDRLENYVIALGIRGLSRYEENWTRRYRGLAPEEVPEINGLRLRFLEEVGAFARELGTGRKTVAERTRTLYEFVERNEIQRKLKRQEQFFAEAGEEAMAKEYAQIYGIIMNLFDKLAEVLGDEELSLTEYRQVLEAGLAEASVGVIPPSADQVLIGDNERTRLRDVRILFFAGVNDGLIPRAGRGGGILSENDREELEAMEIPLSPTAREEMYMQRFHLYRNLTRPSEELYLSFSRANAKGEAAAPSYLISVIRSLYPKLAVEEEPEEVPELPGSAVPVFLAGLEAAAGGSISPLFAELYRWYAAHPGQGVSVERCRQAAFAGNPGGVIDRSAASALYGQILTNSATRLEQYAACAFAHFAEYGLMLEERARYEFRAADLGTVLHEALERFSGKLAARGISWREMDDALREELTGEVVDELLPDYGNTILQSSSRMRAMTARVRRILRRTVWALQEQVKKGDFEPGEFEVSFAMEDSLSAINIALSDREKLRLRGRIDRVDRCETEDKIYIRVIDYKSGRTTLDLAALYYGLQLQLVVYLNAAVELEEKRHPGKRVEPAGIFYYHVDDPMLEKQAGESEAEWAERMLASLRMDGLVNDDPEIVAKLDGTLDAGRSSGVIPVAKKKDGGYTSYSKVAAGADFDTIRNYAKLKVRQLGREILDGSVKAEPYQMGQRNACAYCPYHGICGFDQRLGGYRFRRLEKLDTDVLLAAMREAAKGQEE